MEYCLFCDGIESSYQPKCEYVCSGCVILLCDADQDDLRRAYQKAIKHGIDRKAQALKMFIEKEDAIVRNENPKRDARNLAKHRNRTRDRKTSRSHQRPTRPVTKEQRAAVC